MRVPDPLAAADRGRTAMDSLLAAKAVIPAWPSLIDLRALSQIDPQPPQMIIDDWLPAGYATLLAGHGGIGKSAIALHLAVCISTGRDFFGLAVKQRKVLYLSCEDRESVLHWRLMRICDYIGLRMANLAGKLDILDLVGHDTVLYRPDKALPAAYTELRLAMAGHDVLIVDGIADVYGGSENARAEVKQFVNQTLALIPADTGAVILIGHVAKPAASGITTSEGYSGSTGWHNSVRARWYLAPEVTRAEAGEEAEKTGGLILELQKSNLGRTDQKMRFRWDQYAHLFVGERMEGPGRLDREARDRSERAGIVAALREGSAGEDYVPAATTGPRTAWHVLSAAKSFPETLRDKPGKRRFWQHVEQLRRMGEVREGDIRRADRKRTITLELAEPEIAGFAANAPMRDLDIGSGIAAEPGAAYAANAAGGYRGRAHAQCVRCNGEGCGYCEPG